MKCTLQIALVFDEWRDEHNQSLRLTTRGKDLSMGQFHSGTTFPATITLDVDDAMWLAESLQTGARPTFEAMRRHEESLK